MPSSDKHARKKSRPLLAIGGLDPSGHAGILADFRVFENLSQACRFAATAVTAQSKNHCYGYQSISPHLLRQQLFQERPNCSGVKLGMLGSAKLALVLLKWLNQHPRLTFLWDPVWRASSGAFLIDPPGFGPILKKLLQRADLFTPNLPEAEWVLGRKIRDLTGVTRALTDLHALGTRKRRVVVLKGGHFQEQKSDLSTDWLYDGKKTYLLKARRRPSTRRGTGCTFGAAMLVGIARGYSPLQAARFAKNYVLTHLLDAPTP